MSEQTEAFFVSVQRRRDPGRWFNHIGRYDKEHESRIAYGAIFFHLMGGERAGDYIELTKVVYDGPCREGNGNAISSEIIACANRMNTGVG